jgi:hypothetical protein
MSDPSLDSDSSRIGTWTASDLDADDVARVLETAGHGVLALADDGESYAIPISFGYGGDGSLYFQFGFGESSRKRTFLDSTTQATLVVSDVQSMTEWTSVVVAGPIEPVDDAEDPAAADAFAAFADNAFVPRNALDGDLNATDFTLYELSIESATGRFGN